MKRPLGNILVLFSFVFASEGLAETYDLSFPEPAKPEKPEKTHPEKSRPKVETEKKEPLAEPAKVETPSPVGENKEAEAIRLAKEQAAAEELARLRKEAAHPSFRMIVSGTYAKTTEVTETNGFSLTSPTLLTSGQKIESKTEAGFEATITLLAGRNLGLSFFGGSRVSGIEVEASPLGFSKPLIEPSAMLGMADVNTFSPFGFSVFHVGLRLNVNFWEGLALSLSGRNSLGSGDTNFTQAETGFCFYF